MHAAELRAHSQSQVGAKRANGMHATELKALSSSASSTVKRQRTVADTDVSPAWRCGNFQWRALANAPRSEMCPLLRIRQAPIHVVSFEKLSFLRNARCCFLADCRRSLVRLDEAASHQHTHSLHVAA